MIEFRPIPIAKLAMNTGQIEGLPANPRQWTQEDLDKLAKSIEETPELLEARGAIVVEHGGKFVVLGGNMRVTAARKLGLKEVPCAVLPADTPVKKLREVVVKDNGAFGAWDFDALANEWDDLPLTDWGVPAWEIEQAKSNGATDDYEDFGDVKLADRFIVAPFSVLDTTSAEWQERKKKWLEKTGNLSTTRDGEFGRVGGAESSLYDTINGGTSNFDPVLAEIVYRWFCPLNGSVLDPFGGEQTKGVVAGELGLKYTAVEFRSEQVKFNQKYTSKYRGVAYFCGDSNKISEIVQQRGLDLCFTSPPYYDLEVYSKDDMSALGTYGEFMQQYENIFAQCYEMLDDNAFLVLKVGEIRDKAGVMRGFVSDNIRIMQKIGFKYYNEIILLQAVGTAAIRANNAMAARKVVKRHQNVLVFVKGDIKKAVAKLPSLDYAAKTEDAGPIDEAVADIECEEGGEFFNEMRPIYAAFSGKETPRSVTETSEGLQEFLLIASGSTCVPQRVTASERITPTLDAKKVVLAFTGGKDSTASAVRLQEQGYSVELVFLKNLNKSYPQEEGGAKRIAALLGLPLHIIPVRITGKNAHADNPVKNQLIMSLLADYAVKMGAGKVSMGVVPVLDANYEYNWSDGEGVMGSYVKYLTGRIAGLEYVYAGGEIEADNIATIYKHPKGQEILENITSCVGTHRFRANLRKSNEKKYGIKLSDNECGSCYKCAYSHIVRSALGEVTSLSFLRKCFDIIWEKGDIYHKEHPAGSREFLALHFGNNLLDKIESLYERVKDA